MQSVSSRIWTRVAVSISNDNNHYTTGTYLETYSYNSLLRINISYLKPHNYVQTNVFVKSK